MHNSVQYFLFPQPVLPPHLPAGLADDLRAAASAKESLRYGPGFCSSFTPADAGAGFSASRDMTAADQGTGGGWSAPAAWSPASHSKPSRGTHNVIMLSGNYNHQ